MTRVPTPSPSAESTSPSSSGGSPRTRRRRLVWALSAFIIVLAAMVLLGIPLASVPRDAKAAKADLTSAMVSLKAGDVTSARAAVERARAHVDAAQHDAQSIGGRLWSRIPYVGTPVSDLQHLTQALSDATSVAETGVQLYPSVAGDQATLFRNNRIDRATLDRVIAGARKAGRALTSAQNELQQVRGTTPFIGSIISRQRDAAASRIDPMAEGYSRMAPMLSALPRTFGFEGKRSYLIALLNPAELRYSGGATLAFAPMTWDHGKMQLQTAFNLVDDSRLRSVYSWPGVKGNPFHATDTHLANATFAPSWSVSGEELLRAWQSATGDHDNGVMAVDVVALARLLQATGPATVPGLGQVTSNNLVKILVGSYDDYYPDASAQERKNTAVASSLERTLFSGGNYVAKARALKSAADGRHLALYFRDPQAESGFADLGLQGDLASGPGDYLGVFTQSTVGSKVDYWQRRQISLDVALDRDGRATDRLQVQLHNDTPPYVGSGPDPREGYFTRWSSLAAATFLPGAAEVKKASLGGQPWGGKIGTFYDHSFVQQQTVIPPTKTARLAASYTVPGAASVSSTGGLTYHLAMDPQGTVFPAAVEVTLHLPDGYRATSLPSGWTAQGNTVTFTTDALEATAKWTITAKPTN